MIAGRARAVAVLLALAGMAAGDVSAAAQGAKPAFSRFKEGVTDRQVLPVSCEWDFSGRWNIRRWIKGFHSQRYDRARGFEPVDAVGTSVSLDLQSIKKPRDGWTYQIWGTSTGGILWPNARGRVSGYATQTHFYLYVVYDHPDSNGLNDEAYWGWISADGDVDGKSFFVAKVWSDPDGGGRWTNASKVKCADRMTDSERLAASLREQQPQFVAPILPPTNPAPPALLRECAPGFVWRAAGAGDRTCVTMEARAAALADNKHAGERIDPNAGYGQFGCRSGFVWREAFDGDVICVTPETRMRVRNDNALRSTREK
jgi:hypothetical protein